MTEHHFTCTLLSDVVITARAATEGSLPSLDYIPGAKFMGILARRYTEHDESTQLDLFHNGRVAFGNAYPLSKGERYWPAPNNLFYPKGKKLAQAASQVYAHHLHSEEEWSAIMVEGKRAQLKQLRGGYLDETGEHYLSVATYFELKTAYDRTSRRSKDSQLFGYFALPRGMQFHFRVSDFTDRHTALMQQLVGTHHVGRSRTAQYGRVRIEQHGERTASPPTEAVKTVYAAADLCLIDACGQYTEPTAELLGINGTIDWNKSQVRYRRYQSWNGKRHNRNADRWVVQRGSVFALEDGAHRNNDSDWVGVGRNEGFGRVWYDAPFLDKKAFKLQRATPHQTSSRATTGQKDTALLALLARRHAAVSTERTLLKNVNAAVAASGNTYTDINSSQWSTVRNYARHAANDETLRQLIFNEKTGVLYRGQSERAWRGKRKQLERLVLIENRQHARDFLIQFAAQMAKRAKKQAV